MQGMPSIQMQGDQTPSKRSSELTSETLGKNLIFMKPFDYGSKKPQAIVCIIIICLYIIWRFLYVGAGEATREGGEAESAKDCIG